jgi:predicted DNA-binding protein
MPTTKKRLNLTLPKDIEMHIDGMAKAEGVPAGKIAIELIKIALELEDDAYFAKKAEERAKKKNKLIPQDEAWKQILK